MEAAALEWLLVIQAKVVAVAGVALMLKVLMSR
jgi:hypothetical protein